MHETRLWSRGVGESLRTDEEIEKEAVEMLAELEHEQWSEWVSRVIATEDHISPKRLRRWERLSKTPYKKLTEDEKEDDRFYARKAFVLSRQIARILNKSGDCTNCRHTKDSDFGREFRTLPSCHPRRKDYPGRCWEPRIEPCALLQQDWVDEYEFKLRCGHPYGVEKCPYKESGLLTCPLRPKSDPASLTKKLGSL